MFILLDIDGVMVPAKGWKSPENMEDGFPMFSAQAVRALNTLLAEDIESEIVLTTSHKSRFAIEAWKQIFETRGVNVSALSCLPANDNHLHRIDEISNWINLHPMDDNFIILDDDSSLHALPAHIKDRWLKTSPLIGLTMSHVADVHERMDTLV